MLIALFTVDIQTTINKQKLLTQIKLLLRNSLEVDALWHEPQTTGTMRKRAAEPQIT